MYLIHNHKLCFLASPRTASKATARLLVKQYRGKVVGTHHSPPTGLMYGWTVATTVRNHWDAMVSWYYKIKRREPMGTLEQFIPEWFLGKSKYCYGHKLFPHVEHANVVMRYETLAEDFNALMTQVGLSPCVIPPVIDSDRNKRPYQELYTDRAREMVGNYFADEIERLGYGFEDLPGV